jgi:hypothetical protein
MCYSAFEAPVQLILVFSMMYEGITPQPGQVTKTLVDRLNTEINISYYELIPLSLSVFLLVCRHKSSWQKFYFNKWLDFFLIAPSVLFLLSAGAAIATCSNIVLISIEIAIILVANWVVLHQIDKQASFSSVTFFSCLSLVFPIGCLPTTPRRQNENRTYFWLAITKKCLLLLILLALNVIFK